MSRLFFSQQSYLIRFDSRSHGSPLEPYWWYWNLARAAKGLRPASREVEPRDRDPVKWRDRDLGNFRAQPARRGPCVSSLASQNVWSSRRQHRTWMFREPPIFRRGDTSPYERSWEVDPSPSCGPRVSYGRRNWASGLDFHTGLEHPTRSQLVCSH